MVEFKTEKLMEFYTQKIHKVNIISTAEITDDSIRKKRSQNTMLASVMAKNE